MDSRKLHKDKHNNNFQRLISYIYDKTVYCLCVFLDNPVIIISTICLILIIIESTNPSIFTKAAFSMLFMFFLLEVVKLLGDIYSTNFYAELRKEEEQELLESLEEKKEEKGN